jgi:hypothetical protein
MTRGWSFCIAIIVTVAAVVADTQSRTSDGVSAILRGDSQQAAAILQPIAEDWRQRDPVAAFFMATLYDSGRGVPPDPMRACALYQQAFEDRNSVYAQTAQMLQRHLWLVHGNDWYQECQLVASIGVNHHFQNETFTLGAGHSVEWTVAAATVTYDGVAKRTPYAIRARAIVFLPVQHTDLQAPGSGAPLHFFELFWWEPTADKWRLRWALYEVYRDELVAEGMFGDLTTVTAQEPPALTSSDLAGLVRLRLDPEGAVELTTLAKGRVEKQIIPTRAEKLATREKERILAAADARIDWNAALDVDRAPAMTYMHANGCGDIFLFASSEDRGEVVTLRADAGSLELTPQARRFDLAKERRALSLQIHVYERPTHPNLCTDVVMPMPLESIWQAVSGIVEIELSPRGAVDPRAQYLRRATVHVLNAEFVSPSGRRIRLNRPVTMTATVGGIF